MKFLLSPSKTMHAYKEETGSRPLFQAQTKTLLQTMKRFSSKELESFYQVKHAIAEENYQRFQAFKEENLALYSYTGQQFKALDVMSLEKESIDYLKEHLLVMSGLYGLVRGSDLIGLYRLAMGQKMEGEKLDRFWRPTLTAYLQGEAVVNLASKEYSDALDLKKLNVLTIDFYEVKEGKRKSHAMFVKKMRGLFMRYAALVKAKDFESLKSFNLGNARFIAEESTNERFVFVCEE